MPRASFFRQVLTELEGYGYEVQWAALNSLQFGLAQYRLSVYITGAGRDRQRHKWDLPIVTPGSLHLGLV